MAKLVHSSAGPLGTGVVVSPPAGTAQYKCGVCGFLVEADGGKYTISEAGREAWQTAGSATTRDQCPALPAGQTHRPL